MSRELDTNDVSLGAKPRDPYYELQAVREALKGLRFGTVTIVVQDGVIVQIDRMEKRRIRPTNSRNSQDCTG